MSKTATKKRKVVAAQEVVHGKNLLQKAGKYQQEGESKLRIIGMPEAKSDEQGVYIESLQKNTCTIANGVAGTGKTMIAIQFGAYLLQQKKVERIVISRPAVEANGEKIGYLPGDVHDKLAGYLRPMIAYLQEVYGKEEVETMIADGRVEIIPLCHMKGVTLKKAYIIIDEAQNCTLDALKSVITRLGNGSKVVLNGDLKQCDLTGTSGLSLIAARLQGCPSVGICPLTTRSVMRSEFVRNVEEAFQRSEQEYVKDWDRDTLSRAEAMVR